MKMLLFVLLCTLCSRGASAQLSPTDEKVIRALAAHWVVNMNDHRFKQMRTYTIPTLSVVNRMGMAIHGQAEVIQTYQRLFDVLNQGVVFQESDVMVREVSPDAAMLNDILTQVPAPSDGVKTGTPGPDRLQRTMFLVKQQGRWLVAASQATPIDLARIKTATAAMAKK